VNTLYKSHDMRGTTVFLRVWLLALVGVGLSESHPNLRGGVRTPENGGRQHPHNDVHMPLPTARRLQELAGVVVNSLISLVTPAISSKLSYVVGEHYNEYNLEWVQEEGFVSAKRLGRSLAREETDNAKACGGSDLEVGVSFAANHASGLGNMTIETIHFVPGTQDINLVSRGFRVGAEWSGQWLVNVWIPKLITNTTTTFNTSCNDNANGMATEKVQSINGTTTFNDVEITAIVTVTGNTERIVLFPTTSELSTGRVDNFTYQHEEMDTTNILGGTPTADFNFDAEAVVNSLLFDAGGSKELREYFQQLYVKALQEEIDYLLPRSLVGDGFNGGT
jgi:hypothetical protein